MKRRILALVLTLAMLLPCLMGKVAATSDVFVSEQFSGSKTAENAIAEEEDYCTFTTFEDLQELAKETYSQATDILYIGSGALVISEDLTLPENITLWNESTYPIIVAKGITLAVSQDSAIDTSEMDIKGTLIMNNASLFVMELTVTGDVAASGYGLINVGHDYYGGEIAVTGSLVSSVEIRIQEDTVISGKENVTFTGGNSFTLSLYTYSMSDFRELVDRATGNSDSHYDIYLQAEEDVTIDGSIAFPSNSSIRIEGYNGYNPTVCIAAGTTVTVDDLRSFTLCGSLVVEGKFVNNDYIGIQDGTLNIAPTGSYSGTGTISMISWDCTSDYVDSITGLDTSRYSIIPAKSNSDNLWAWQWVIAPKPDAPVVRVTANAKTGEPQISWGVVKDAEKYRIYRANSKSGKYNYLETTSSTSFIDRSAVVGKNYYYKVRAVDTEWSEQYNNTYSAYSNIVNRVCDLAKPVVSQSVNATTGKPVVKWKTVGGAAKYYVYRSTSKSSGYEKVYTAVSARSYTDKEAEAGSNYYYKVMAIHSNSSANSAYSAIVNRVCDLAKPTITLTRTSSGNPWVKWTAVKDADGYEVWRATSKSGTYKKVKTTVSGTSFADRDVTEGKTYYYKVRAIHDTASANSAYSSVKYITAK